MTQTSNVYRRGKFFFVVTMSKTVDGLWICADPCLKIPADCPPEELGALVVKSLDQSRQKIPHPSFKDDSHLRPILEISGLKSWSTFAKGSALAVVRRDGDTVTVEPHENQGRGGFVPVESPAVTLRDASPGDLGNAVGRELG